MATKLKPQTSEYVDTLVSYIIEGKLRQESQINAALEYLLKHIGQPLNESALNSYCGAGVNVSNDLIDDVIKEILQKHITEIKDGSFSKNRLLGMHSIVFTK